MKRLISLLLALVLVIGLVPSVHAAQGAVSSNINDHWYINAQRWTDPIKSTLAAEAGGYLRVECIDSNLVVERYDSSFQYLSGQTIPLELPIYGGVYVCEDYNFVVVGQENPEESDEVEVFRIIRYSKDWEKIDHASIYGANTIVPFQGGSLRFDRSGNMLYVRTSHKMYTADDGLNHQANVMIALRISDMTVTDALTQVLNSAYGYVSHSFNQFVRVDGDTLLAVDHGDYYPRSVCLFKYPNSASSETFFGRTSMVNVLPIVDSTYHYNDTGVSVGGFECSTTDYLVAGSSYDQIESADLMEVHRNIFVTATPKDNFTDEDTTIHWLTSYTAEDAVSVSPPHLLKLSADRFFLTWTENNVLKYCFLDGQGQLEGQIYTGEGDLSDCVPILDGNRIFWYVTNYSAPVFYQIDLNSPGSVTIPHVHSYTYTLTTAPTESAAGLLSGSCSKCADVQQISLPKLSEADYDYTILTAPGHNTEGLARYTWRITDYGVWSFDVTIPACTHSFGEWQQTTAPGCETEGTERRDCTRCGHSETRSVSALGHAYESVVTDPTCTEPGFTTHTCSRCADTYTDSYTAAKGHSFRSWHTVTEPTCTAPGLEQRECVNCTVVETKQIPMTEHTYLPHRTDPTCTEQGYITMICSGCGDSYINQYIEATGHSWDEGVVIQEPTETELGICRYTCLSCGAIEDRPHGHVHSYDAVVTAPTCTQQGFTTYTCSECGYSYVGDYTAALGHDHIAVVTEPGCTEGGYTTHTCSRCGDSYADSHTEALGHDWKGLDCTRCDAARENPFTDTDPTRFYFDPVLWAVENGITKGTSATKFSPDASCTRGQVVTFLWRAAGSPEPRSSSHPFTDVSEKAFYYKAMLWAVENGITSGMSATTFAPDGICTRGQVVTFLWRAKGKPAAVNTAHPFTDVSEGAFYYDAMLWAVENGVTSGMSASTFVPGNPCTRGQVVTFLYRTFG